MAGSAAVLETVLRSGLPGPLSSLLPSAFFSFSSNLVLQLDTGCAPTWEAQTSLAATLLKLLHLPDDPGTSSVRLVCQVPLLSAPGVGTSLHSALAAVRRFMHRSKGLSVQVQLVKGGSSEYKKARRLHAILALTLARLTVWGMREHRDPGMAKGLQETAMCLAREVVEGDDRLGQLSSLQHRLSWDTSCLRDDDYIIVHEARFWESYGLQHFQGRLLPGCDRSCCTQLKRVSEATMPTLLCSGCRRVRYCDKKCQAVAWIEGRHSEFCGKSACVWFNTLADYDMLVRLD